MEHLIDAIGPTEFAFLVDLDNDGKADDLLPQFTGAADAPQGWLEAPADPTAAGIWTFHATDWQQKPIPAPPSRAAK